MPIVTDILSDYVLKQHSDGTVVLTHDECGGEIGRSDQTLGSLTLAALARVVADHEESEHGRYLPI